MKRFYITILATASILVLSCVASNNEPLNTVIDISRFSHKVAHSKYKKVVPVTQELLYGDWTIIASFFTIQSRQSVSTFQLEGRKYTINEDGTLISDNTAFGYGKSAKKWMLKSNNTVFDEGNESWHIRVKGDTMEWIEQIDEDYSYFVLVK